MIRTALTSYRETYDAFRWDIPRHFNFGADVVDWWAEHNDELALIWCNESGAEHRITFSEISQQSNRFANLLVRLGIGPGERVLVMLPRISERQIAMVGCLKLGAIPIPGIEMLTGADVAYRVEICPRRRRARYSADYYGIRSTGRRGEAPRSSRRHCGVVVNAKPVVYGKRIRLASGLESGLESESRGTGWLTVQGRGRNQWRLQPLNGFAARWWRALQVFSR